MLKQFAIGTALLGGLACAGVARAQTPPLPSPPAAAEAPKPDYADPKAWLCRPGAHDACDIDETTTIVAANGTLTKETWKADPSAPISGVIVVVAVVICCSSAKNLATCQGDRFTSSGHFARPIKMA